MNLFAGIPFPLKVSEGGEYDEAATPGRLQPSVMLAEKLYCLGGKSATAVFTYLFLQRFPREIRMLLSQDNPADMGAIAVKVDC